MMFYDAGLRLSTATILSRWIMEEGAPHTVKRSKGSIVVSIGCPLAPVYKGERGEEAGQEDARQEESYSHRE